MWGKISFLFTRPRRSEKALSVTATTTHQPMCCWTTRGGQPPDWLLARAHPKTWATPENCFNMAQNCTKVLVNYQVVGTLSFQRWECFPLMCYLQVYTGLQCPMEVRDPFLVQQGEPSGLVQEKKMSLGYLGVWLFTSIQGPQSCSPHSCQRAFHNSRNNLDSLSQTTVTFLSTPSWVGQLWGNCLQLSAESLALALGAVVTGASWRCSFHAMHSSQQTPPKHCCLSPLAQSCSTIICGVTLRWRHCLLPTQFSPLPPMSRENHRTVHQWFQAATPPTSIVRGQITGNAFFSRSHLRVRRTCSWGNRQLHLPRYWASKRRNPLNLESHKSTWDGCT